MKTKLQKAFDQFDEAAKNWGYVENEGWGKQIENSRQRYNDAKNDLITMLEKLDKELV